MFSNRIKSKSHQSLLQNNSTFMNPYLFLSPTKSLWCHCCGVSWFRVCSYVIRVFLLRAKILIYSMIQSHDLLIHYSLLSQQVLCASAQLLQASPGRGVMVVVKCCSSDHHHRSRIGAPILAASRFNFSDSLWWPETVDWCRFTTRFMQYLLLLYRFDSFSATQQCYLPYDWHAVTLLNALPFGLLSDRASCVCSVEMGNI